MKRRILSMALALVMIISLLPVTTFAASAVEVNTLADLQAALADNNVQTVTITEMIVIPADQTVVIDLNGKTVTVPDAESHIFAIDNQGELTLKDTVGGGSITSRGIYNGYNGNAENAKLTIESGTYVAMDSKDSVAILNGAELVINGGEFSGIVSAVNNALDTSNTTINGGTFAGGYVGGKSTNYIIQNNKGSLTINNANIVSGFGGVGAYGGTVVINNGNFMPVGWEGYTSHVVYVSQASDVTINGGTFKMNYPANAVPDSGEAVSSYFNGKLTINGGEFYAHFDHLPPVQLSSGSVIKGGKYMYHSGAACTHAWIKNYVAEGYKLNEDGTVTDPNAKAYAAQIGATKFESLQTAIEAVKDGETITLLGDLNVTTKAYGNNALNHARAVSFTLDLNGKTLSADPGNSLFRFNITAAGATSDVVVTIKNGKVVSGANTWCALMSAGYSANIKAIMNLEDLIVENSKAGDLAIKAWDHSLINAKNVTVNSTNCAGGFYAVGGEIVLDNCTVNQKGLHTAPYLSMAVAVSNGGKATVNSGIYSTEPTAAAEGYNQGTSHGSWVAGVMNSGGTLIINGGTFTNGNFGDDALATAARGLLTADTYGVIEVYGGTFNALNKIFDLLSNLANKPSGVATIYGGTYSKDPTIPGSWTTPVLGENYVVEENLDGTYSVVAAAHEHKFELVEEIAPTVSAPGYKVFKCACGETKKEESGAQLSAPELTLNGNVVTLTDASGIFKQMGVTYLGKDSGIIIEDVILWGDFTELAKTGKTLNGKVGYTNLADAKEATLIDGGDYVFYLTYADGAKNGIRFVLITLEAENTAPEYSVSGNEATLNDNGNTIVQSGVKYVGKNSTIDADKLVNWSEFVALEGLALNGKAGYTNLGKEVNVELEKNGDYIFYVIYKDANDATKTVYVKCTVAVENNKPVITNENGVATLVDNGFTVVQSGVKYVGKDSTIDADMIASWSEFTGLKGETLNGRTGYTNLGKATQTALNKSGDYIFYVIYKDADGVTKTVYQNLEV